MASPATSVPHRWQGHPRSHPRILTLLQKQPSYEDPWGRSQESPGYPACGCPARPWVTCRLWLRRTMELPSEECISRHEHLPLLAHPNSLLYPSSEADILILVHVTVKLSSVPTCPLSNPKKGGATVSTSQRSLAWGLACTGQHSGCIGIP